VRRVVWAAKILKSQCLSTFVLSSLRDIPHTHALFFFSYVLLFLLCVDGYYVLTFQNLFLGGAREVQMTSLTALMAGTFFFIY